MEGVQFREHYDNHGVMATNGKLAENLNLTNVPAITEAVALESALTHINATKYAWNDTMFTDSVLLLYPKGQLVYYNPYNDYNPSHYKLAWKFGVVVSEPRNSYNIYIDAITGLYIDKISTLCNGDANTHY